MRRTGCGTRTARPASSVIWSVEVRLAEGGADCVDAADDDGTTASRPRESASVRSAGAVKRWRKAHTIPRLLGNESSDSSLRTRQRQQKSPTKKSGAGAHTPSHEECQSATAWAGVLTYGCKGRFTVAGPWPIFTAFPQVPKPASLSPTSLSRGSTECQPRGGAKSDGRGGHFGPALSIATNLSVGTVAAFHGQCDSGPRGAKCPDPSSL